MLLVIAWCPELLLFFSFSSWPWKTHIVPLQATNQERCAEVEAELAQKVNAAEERAATELQILRAKDERAQVDAAFRLAFGRAPTSSESSEAVDYAQRHGLAGLCRLIFNLNEFVFVD